MFDDTEKQDRLTAALNSSFQVGVLYQDSRGFYYYPNESARELGTPIRLSNIPARLLEDQDAQLLEALREAGLTFEWSQIVDDQGRTWTYGEESWNLPLVQLAMF